MAKTARGSGLDNRKKIIDAAIAIIGEKGVDKTSLARISKVSGLSKGTLYYYYASKNDLIFDIADLHMERITADLFSMIEKNRGLSWEELLTAFFNILLTSHTRSRLHLYLVREAVSGNHTLKVRFRNTYLNWFDMVARAASEMPGPPIDLRAKSKFLVAVVDGFILQSLLEVDEVSINEIVRLMVKVIA